MKLYNSNTQEIENITTILVDNFQRYADKMSEAERNSQGYYNVVYPNVTAGKKLGTTGTLVLDEDEQGNTLATGKHIIDLIDKTLEQLKAEKKNEILQGFDNALNSVFKILSARPIYFKATEYHQERLLKLDNLSDKAIKVYNLNEADYTFDTFDCFDNEGKDLNDQIVSKAEIDEMVLAMGQRVLSLEGQRNDKLKASDKAQNETELNNVDITF